MTKVAISVIFSILGLTAAFTPSTHTGRTSVTLHAEQQSRKVFFSSAAAVAFGALIPTGANAGTMSQENISDPTEQWETGSPTPEAARLRVGRYTNARTQMTSSFPPQKRLTLERKSPVTRLDINSPDFGAYKKTFPGLYKTLEQAQKEK